MMMQFANNNCSLFASMFFLYTHFKHGHFIQLMACQVATLTKGNEQMIFITPRSFPGTRMNICMILPVVHLQIVSTATTSASAGITMNDLLPANTPSFIQQLLLVLI